MCSDKVLFKVKPTIVKMLIKIESSCVTTLKLLFYCIPFKRFTLVYLIARKIRMHVSLEINEKK